MPATVTLPSTTLGVGVADKDTLVSLVSTSGVYTGLRLYIDGELMKVVSLDVDPWVRVIRGVDGTAAAPHPSTATVYVGRGDQFYQSDPTGRPPAAIPVSPYINVINGAVWFAQGDIAPSVSANRWWQKQTAIYTLNPLGIRTATLDPTTST